MLNPSNILAAIRDAYITCPTIMAIVDDPNRITTHGTEDVPEYDITRAIYQAGTPSLLITYQGFGPARSPDYWRHAFRVYVRGGLTLLWSLVEGVPSESGVKLLLHEFLPELGSMQVPSSAPRQLVINDSEAIDYWTLDMSVDEKGDN